MRVIGIEIFSKEVGYVVLDDTGGQLQDITETYKRPQLEDDDDRHAIKMFRNVLFATFDRYQPDKSYESLMVTVVPRQRISAFIKATPYRSLPNMTTKPKP